MAQQFGLTWWGEQFLDALSDIDFSNRLPRGRGYARRGYVNSILLKKNVVSAKVKGSRRTPYSVEIVIPLFTEQEKKKLMEAIIDDPLLLSHLLNRELPHELFVVAEENGIKIFPRKWSDFKMDCSCPDWATPCKHLAAVIYMLSAEIDRNPFLVFQMHGLDIIEELTKLGMSVEKEMSIPCFEHMFLDEPLDVVEGGNGEIGLFDLSKLSSQTDNLLSLIDSQTVFHSKAFVPILRKYYKAVGRKARLLLNLDVEEYDLSSVETIEETELLIDVDTCFNRVNLKPHNEDIPFDLIENNLEYFVLFLARLPRKYEKRFSPGLRAFYLAYHLSLKLAECGAFMPQLLEVKRKEYVVRWIPALINKEVNDLLIELQQCISGDLIKVRTAIKKRKYLSHRDQTISLVSLFLTHYMKSVDVSSSRNAQDEDLKIEDLFFNGKRVDFRHFSEKQIPESIYQYLQRFYMSDKSYVPLIKVVDNPADNTFDLQVWIENRKDSMHEPVCLEEFMQNGNYNEHKASVLQSLSGLSRDFEDIKTLVSSSGKEKLLYDSDVFAEVLLTVLPLVKMLNIRVLLPNSLKNIARPKVSLKLNGSDSDLSGKTYLNLDQMLSFEWQVAIGDKTIAVHEFRRLVGELSGVVNIKGEYVLVDPDDIQTLLNNIDDGKSLSRVELLQSALSEEYNDAKITISDDARKIVDQLLSSPPMELPNDLNAVLRPYQERGYQWLYNNSQVGFGSIIADDMGLGKTLQVISLLLQYKQEGRFDKKKALVVVPTTLITNWQKEIERFAPGLDTHIYHGAKRELTIDACDIVITSYGMIRSDLSKFQKIKWEVMVIDEAQNIKNPGTEQTKAVKKMKADIRIAMSGTPVENRLSEYWSLFDFVNKGYLGSVKNFIKEFASPIENENNQDKLERFRKVTHPFILRRLKTDKSIISDLPEKIEHDCFIELSKEQTALYENVVETMLKALNDTEESSIERKGLVLKMITALKQICNHPSQFLKKEDDRIELSGKTQMLLELLRSIYESDEKVLIFTQYKEMGEILARMLEDVMGTKPLFLHGGTERKKRDTMVEEFQNKKHAKIFILSIKAGGTGLNLTAANHVVHYDLWWNPAVEAQATDRAFRIGQKKNVMVHRLISKGTFEERINKMLQDKKYLADKTVVTGEKWIGNLSDSELKELVMM